MTAVVPVITLDGPGGSGKGTVSQLLAQALQWNLLDSGMMYRVLALAGERRPVSFTDEAALAQLAKEMDVRFDNQQPGSVYLAGENVSDAIRTENVGQHASIISAMPSIRDAINQRMREFRQPPGLVTDGRDMGTVVFPDAFLKIYLDADVKTRARRRHQQLHKKGVNVSLAQIHDDIVIRDQRDLKREVAPLKPAEDAIVVDTTHLSAEEVFRLLMDTIEKKRSQLDETGNSSV